MSSPMNEAEALFRGVDQISMLEHGVSLAQGWFDCPLPNY